MANIADLQIRLSGGASNTDPNASLGGAMSTVSGGLIVCQDATATSSISGITIDRGAGNLEGDGILTYTDSSTSATWAPPGGISGDSVIFSADGTYALLGSSGGMLFVTVVVSSLPGANASTTVTIARNLNNVFDDIAAADSLAGDIEYRWLWMTNAGSSTLSSIKLFIKTPTGGPDAIAIGLNPAGVNDVPSTLANENTAPSGVTFSAPTTATAGLSMGTMAAGDDYAFCIRRTITAGNEEAETANFFVIGYQAGVPTG